MSSECISFLSGRITVSKTDPLRLQLAAYVEANYCEELDDWEWIQEIFREVNFAAADSFMAYINDWRTADHIKEDSKIMQIVFQILINDGLDWNQKFDHPKRRRLGRHPPLGWTIQIGRWRHVDTLVEMMLQDRTVEWKQQVCCIPVLFDHAVGGLPTWKKIIHKFDHDTLAFALRYFWGLPHEARVTKVLWTTVWMDLCEQTSETGMNLFTKLCDDCNDGRTAFDHFVVFEMKRIYEGKHARRTHLTQVLQDLYVNQHHHGIFRLIIDFDGGISKHDAMQRRFEIGDWVPLPPLPWVL